MTAAREIAGIAGLSVAAAALALVDGPVVLRLPLGLLGAGVLPGLALGLVAFGRRAMPVAERWALAVPFSVALLIVGAPILDATPWRLDARAVVVSTSGLTLVLCALASIRTRAEQIVPTVDRPSPVPRRVLPAIALATLVVGGVALVLAVGNEPRPPTEFYVVGPGQLAETYPTVVDPGDPLRVSVGIRNGEATATSFRVVVEAGRRRLASLDPIMLDPHETWVGAVEFGLPTAGRDQHVSIVLLRDGDAEPYRSLRLWVDVRGGA